MFNCITKYFLKNKKNLSESGKQDKTSVISNKERTELFEYPESPAERKRIEEIFNVINSIPTGRRQLHYLEKTYTGDPISICFSEMSDCLGYLKDGKIYLKKRNQKLTPRRDQQLLLEEAGTLIHELEHLQQEILCKEYQDSSKLPALYQVYITLLEEAGANARQMFFEEEIQVKYPSLTQDMAMMCNTFRSGTELVRDWVIDRDPCQVYNSYIDDVLLLLLKSERVKMTPAIKERFINGVETLLKHMMCSLKYADIPIEKMRGFKSIKKGYSIQGHDLYAELDKNGNFALLIKGCCKRPHEREVILFEDPETKKYHILYKNNLKTHHAMSVFNITQWSQPVRGSDERVRQLLTRNNFRKALRTYPQSGR